MRKVTVFCSMGLTILALTRSASVQASTDAPILLEILSNATSQLTQLMTLVENAQSNINLMRDVNSGISESLALYQSIPTPSDPGLYSDWKQVGDALRSLQTIYGAAVPSKLFQIQSDNDKLVAEALTLNNKIYDFSREIDTIANQIKSRSGTSSPKGAQRLTAQSLGVLIQATDQSLRTQASSLKLQAQALALQNKKDKEAAKDTLRTTNDLRDAMRNDQPRFYPPRF